MNLTRRPNPHAFIINSRGKSFGAGVISALLLCALHLAEPARARPAVPQIQGGDVRERKREAPAEVERRAIAVGRAVSGELEEGKEHAYVFTAKKGQYMRFVFEPADWWVESFLQPPRGLRMKGIQGTTLTRRLIIFSHVAEISGEYRLLVRGRGDKPARYEVRLETLRDATPEDYTRAEAERLFVQAETGELPPDPFESRVQGLVARRDRRIGEYYQRSLDLWRRLDEPAWEARTLDRIAREHVEGRDYPQALDATRQALSIWRTLGNRTWEAETLQKLADLHQHLGNKEAAVRSIEQGLKLWRSLPEDQGLPRALNLSAQFYNNSGDKKRARELYEEFLWLMRRAGNHSGEAYVLYQLGNLYQSVHDEGHALKLFSESYVAAQNSENQYLSRDALTKINSLTARSQGSAAAAGGPAVAIAKALPTPTPTPEGPRGPATAAGGPRDTADKGELSAGLSSDRASESQLDERALWASVRELASPPAFEAYLKLYPDGRFAAEARARLASLAAPTADADPTAIQRYPVIESQNPVQMGQPFALQVWLLKEPLKKAAEAAGPPAPGPVVVQPDPLKTPWKVEVILTAPDFELDGSNIVNINLPADGDSEPAVFRLKPKPFAGAQRTSTIYATIRYEENFLARISEEVTIVSAPSGKGTGGGGSPLDGLLGPKLPDDVRKDAVTTRGPGRDTDKEEGEKAPQPGEGERAKEEVKSRPRINIEKNAPAPDLTVEVVEGFDPAHPELTLIRVSSRFFKGEVFFPRRNDQQGWIDENYDLFSRMGPGRAKLAGRPAGGRAEAASAVPPPELAVTHLRGFGRELYRRFAPELFKSAFWTLRDELGDSFRSIQIYTNNPNFPWELMRPFRSDDERDFLGVEYSVGRWHQHATAELHKLPLKSARVRELAVIAPEYPGVLELTHQKTELEALALFPGYRRVPGRLSNFKDLFGEFPQGIIHFAGHGVASGTSALGRQFSILLEDGEVGVVAWNGMVTRKSGHNPLIFFNACDLGRTRRVANFVDGWAPATLEAGASGYIGALWPLNDEGAAQFGADFYRTLMKQLEEEGVIFVADVLRLTRQKFTRNSDPTYLGYVFYGDPNLKLVSDPKKK